MQRFWVIRNPHADLYYADVHPDRLWTTDELFGVRFDTEDLALTFIATNLGGKGYPVEIIAPRPPHGPPKWPYGPADEAGVFQT